MLFFHFLFLITLLVTIIITIIIIIITGPRWMVFQINYYQTNYSCLAFAPAALSSALVGRSLFRERHSTILCLYHHHHHCHHQIIEASPHQTDGAESPTSRIFQSPHNQFSSIFHTNADDDDDNEDNEDNEDLKNLSMS